MGSIWLRDLEQVIRPGCPFPVITVSGWETRSRSTGGYETVNGMVVHHDAGGPSSDGWPSVNYQCFLDEDRPNAALHVARDTRIFVMAAGACNTQGKGGPMLGVPKDDGNRRLIGIEQGNTGTGESYPSRQQDATLWLVARLVDVYGERFGWGANNVISHFEWAGPRKCDPGGPSRWTGTRPGCGQARLWTMDWFRRDVALASKPLPTLEDDVAVVIKARDGSATQQFATFAWNGLQIQWVTSEMQLAVGRMTGMYKFGGDGKPLLNFTAADIQDLIDRGWVGGPVPPGWRQPV